MLALDLQGSVVRDSGRIPGLDPGGAEFGPDGQLYLSSGVAPSGQGDNTIAVFDRSARLRTPRLVAFDFRAGDFAGPVVQLPRLNGQALVLVP